MSAEKSRLVSITSSREARLKAQLLIPGRAALAPFEEEQSPLVPRRRPPPGLSSGRGPCAAVGGRRGGRASRRPTACAGDARGWSRSSSVSIPASLLAAETQERCPAPLFLRCGSGAATRLPSHRVLAHQGQRLVQASSSTHIFRDKGTLRGGHSGSSFSTDATDTPHSAAGGRASFNKTQKKKKTSKNHTAAWETFAFF